MKLTKKERETIAKIKEYITMTLVCFIAILLVTFVIAQLSRIFI